MSKHQFYTTAPHPWKSAHKHSADQNQVGWRLHIVDTSVGPEYIRPLGSTKIVVNKSPALCGLRPKHGWARDLFIDRECNRCLKAAERLKIEVPE